MRSAKLNKAARHHMTRSLNHPFAVPAAWLEKQKTSRVPVHLICATIGTDGVHTVDNRGYSLKLMP